MTILPAVQQVNSAKKEIMKQYEHCSSTWVGWARPCFADAAQQHVGLPVKALLNCKTQHPSLAVKAAMGLSWCMDAGEGP